MVSVYAALFSQFPLDGHWGYSQLLIANIVMHVCEYVRKKNSRNVIATYCEIVF